MSGYYFALPDRSHCEIIGARCYLLAQTCDAVVVWYDGTLNSISKHKVQEYTICDRPLHLDWRELVVEVNSQRRSFSPITLPPLMSNSVVTYHCKISTAFPLQSTACSFLLALPCTSHLAPKYKSSYAVGTCHHESDDFMSREAIGIRALLTQLAPCSSD
jgi:hypothetical protein